MDTTENHRPQVASLDQVTDFKSTDKRKEIFMNKLSLTLSLVVIAGSAFAQNNNNTVVRWKTIVGNITVSNNDTVAGINPGTTPCSTTGGTASRKLSTRNFSYYAEGLLVNG